MNRFVEGPVTVRVPATSANLGPGFDALGLALALHDEVTAEVTGHELEIAVTGEGRDVARDESHLVVRAMRTCYTRLGVGAPPGLRLACTNRIPHGRGLGSSAAAIVAGLLLARGLLPDGADRLPDAALLALASEIEGHPDNVAPCLFGGLTVAWIEDSRARAARLPIHESLHAAVVIPPFEASTERARGLLPASVPHADAAANAGRAALLVAALTSVPQYLLPATEDRLHQAYRAPAMPESAALIAALRAAGQAAVISGAGPTVLVLTAGEAPDVTGDVPPGWRLLHPDIDQVGARLTR